MINSTFSTFRNLLDTNDLDLLRQSCLKEHPARVAEYITGMQIDDAWRILRLLPEAHQAEIICHMDADMQQALFLAIDRKEAARIISEMSSDDRADLFQKFNEEQKNSFYPAMAMAEREDVRRLLSYPEGSAGAVMTSDYVALNINMTAADAICQIRQEAPEKETIYYTYVINDERKLIGFVSLKDLIIANPKSMLADFMHTDVLSVRADEDQEVAALLIRKYDFIALPVINAEGTLVGIVTHDDALDVIVQEQQEDMEKMMAIHGSHQPNAYFRTSSWSHFKSRAYWIVALATIGLVSGVIIQSFEESLTSLIILALYMPMVADTGGNTGSQAATVVVRALALGEIVPRDAMKVLYKEIKVSLLLALVLGGLSFCKVIFLSHGADIPQGFSLDKIGATIALALGLQVVTATLVGAMLPLIAARLKQDPAIVASPAITTVVDITGLLIYFGMAKMLLGL